MCDAAGLFIDVSIGNYGACHDSTTFRLSPFGRALEEGSLNLPENRVVRGESLPYFLLGDRAYPLGRHVMRAYAGRDQTPEMLFFNRRLIKARLVIERTFGRLAGRFRCLKSPLDVQPSDADWIVLACCALHNFLQLYRGMNN